MVNILLATYNGEKYIKQQIESILSQSYKDFTLYIHDDGSKDGTIEKIKSFKDDRIQILEDGICLHDSSLNFFHLMINQKECDYFAFCDQDDIWESDKLQIQIDEMKELETRYSHIIPITLGTDLNLIDSQGNEIGESMYHFQEINYNSTYFTQLYENSFTGCTMFMNWAVMNYILKLFEIKKQDSIIQHDWFIANICAADGCIKQLHNKTVNYRQHENNVVGAQKTSLIKHIKDRKIFRTINKIKELKYRCNKQNEIVITLINNEEKKRLTKKICNTSFLLHKYLIIKYKVIESVSLKKRLIKFLFY